MNAGHQTIASSDAARSAGGASIRRGWGRGVVQRAGVFAAAAALAGCAGLGGTATAPSGTPPAGTPQPGVATVTQSPAAASPAAAFSAAVAPTKPSPLRLGDEISFSLSTTAAGYGNLYLLNASGKVVALTENLYVAPGAPVQFPPPRSGFTLRASPPVGPNRVLFLVTSLPFPGFGGGNVTSAPAPLAVPADAFVAQLNTATAQLPANSWALAEARVAVAGAAGG